MSFGIFGIDHVQLTVPRAAEADTIRFYRDVLGLAEIEKPVPLKARGGAWFQVGTAQFHLGIDADASPRSKRHICFLVTDLAKAREAATRQNLVIEEGPGAEGLKRFFVHDPGGNRIEIGQR